MKNSFKAMANQIDKSVSLIPENPKFSLIWLHGLGDSPLGFTDFFTLPQSPLNIGARVKLLHAPINPVTLNGGMKMPSWYDIKSLSFQEGNEQQKYSLTEIKESLAILNTHVQSEVEYWEKQQKKEEGYKRVYVGGFSQGCATSLLYTLTSKNLIGGMVGLSGHLFNSFDLINLQKLPILLFHGKFDGTIPFNAAKKSYKKILGKAMIEFRQKNLQHEVSIEQLTEMTAWLQAHTQALN